MKSEIRDKPAFRVVGLMYRGKNENNEIQQLWGDMIARLPEIRAYINSDDSFGVMGNYDEASGEFDYLAAFGVREDAPVPEGMTAWDVPAHTYAVFPATLVDLGETYRKIREIGLPQTGREYVAGTEFECYPRDFNPEDPKSTLYIYIPVR